MLHAIMYREKGTQGGWKPVARQRVYTEEEVDFLKWDCCLLHRTNKEIYEYCMMYLIPDKDQEIKIYCEDGKSEEGFEEEPEGEEEGDGCEEDAEEVEST